jgi:hypothetical protein
MSGGTFLLKESFCTAGFQDSLVDTIDHYRLNGDVNQAAAIALYAILSFIPLFICHDLPFLVRPELLFVQVAGDGDCSPGLGRRDRQCWDHLPGYPAGGTNDHQPCHSRGGLTLFSHLLFGYLIPFLIVVLFAMAVYRIIPTRKISLISAVIGIVVFAVLMEMAKHFFTWYASHYTRYNVIFGSLETVVILVIWVFYVALIFLFCAELIASYERRDLILLEKALLKTGKQAARVEERLYRKFGRVYPLCNRYIVYLEVTGLPFASLLKEKQGGVVGGKAGGIAPQDGSDGRMALEFLIEELPHPAAAPSPGVTEIGVKGQVALVERKGVELCRFPAEDGEIED